MDTQTTTLPPQVQQTLDDFVRAAQSAFGADLVSIVLYGSAAEGGLRATSDVNVLLVLKRFDRAQVDGIREQLRLARAACRLTAMFLLDGEIAAAADAFAVKFADIVGRHRVLAGSDPFAGRTISLAMRIEHLRQVLLNLKLRLRERYASLSLRDEQLASVVADAAGPLRSAAKSLLDLEGAPAASPKEAMRQIATQFAGPTLVSWGFSCLSPPRLR